MKKWCLLIILMIAFLTATTACSKNMDSDSLHISSQHESKSESDVNIESKTNEPTTAETLMQLENLTFDIDDDLISDIDATVIDSFAKSFVNIYTGALANNIDVSFENYIENNNLLVYVGNLLKLEQLMYTNGLTFGGPYGLDNTFNEIKLTHTENETIQIYVQYDYKGSGRSCDLLVGIHDGKLVVVDVYFGGKDSADTFATGSANDRKLADSDIWNNKDWNDKVSDRLQKYYEDVIKPHLPKSEK